MTKDNRSQGETWKTKDERMKDDAHKMKDEKWREKSEKWKLDMNGGKQWRTKMIDTGWKIRNEKTETREGQNYRLRADGSVFVNKQQEDMLGLLVQKHWILHFP